MKTSFRLQYRLVVMILVLLTLITVVGLMSFQLGYDFTVTNSYGDAITLFGYGIYRFDSAFKAPIFIGSDLTMLVVIVPGLLWAVWRDQRHSSLKTQLMLIALVGVVLYYATSIAFGVTYNALMLAYIALFSVSLFTLLLLVSNLKWASHTVQPIKGLHAFLTITAIALMGIWLMDIIPTWFTGESLALIETYTTEITYVLDMGLISPLLMCGLWLRKRQDVLGDVITLAMVVLCVVMGVMLPIQTWFQLMAGIVIPIPVLIIKVGIFVVLAIAAAYFGIRLLATVSVDLKQNR